MNKKHKTLFIMRFQILIFIAIMALMGSIIVTIQDNANYVSFSASTNKQNYTQGEMMELSLSLDAKEDIENVIIEIHGIKNNDGKYVKNIRDVVNLTKGKNSFKYTDVIPSCSSCSGISKGEHEILFVVINNKNVLVNNTKNIFIV